MPKVSADPSQTVTTTARSNLVDPHSTYSPSGSLSGFGPAQAPLTPRRQGFKPLGRPIEAPLAPERPARRSVGTLDKRTLEAFQKMAERPDQRGSLTLKIGSTRTPKPGFSYLGGASALDALAATISEKGTGALSPITSPRTLAQSPSFPSELDDHNDAAEELFSDSPPPTNHLGYSTPPVPPLMLPSAAQSTSYAVASGETFFFNGGKPFSLQDLNEFFSQHIPPDYSELNPNTEDNYPMQPFNLEPVQIVSLVQSDEMEILTLGRCAINDPTLESICIRNKNLRRVVLFHCLRLENVSFLMRFTKIQELCVSWCTHLSSDCFAGMPEGTWRDLTGLQLANTPITAKALQGFCILPELSSIDLSYCREINDEAFLDLAKHPKLKQIKIEGANVTEAAVAKMKQTMQEKWEDIQIIGEPKYGLAYYLPVPEVGAQVEITLEAAENYPFLRRLMFEVYGIDSWTKLCELEDYCDGIEKFYGQELAARGIDISLWVSLDTFQGWFQAERALQEHDEPNLSKIMEVLVPILIREGYFKKPTTVDDIKNRQGKASVVEVDCFMALWEMTFYPRMLNKIPKLDFSGIGLTEIPLSFCRLYFSQLEHLSFARNPIAKLPKDILEVFPTKKVQSFFSKYPALRSIDFSGCHLESMDGVFSFESRSLEDPDQFERVSVLPNLQAANFSNNRITALLDVFGVSSDRLAEKLSINLRNNRITLVQKGALDDLAASDPVHFIIDLRDNIIMGAHIPNPLPMNVTLLFGVNVEQLMNGPTRRNSEARALPEPSRQHWRESDIDLSYLEKKEHG